MAEDKSPDLKVFQHTPAQHTTTAAKPTSTLHRAIKDSTAPPSTTEDGKVRITAFTMPSTTRGQAIGAIEYQYSKPLPTDVLSIYTPTIFPARINVNAAISDQACWDCRDAMAAAGGLNSRVGCLAVSGNLNATFLPEAPPEKLRVVSWFNEFLALHDGKF